MTVEKFPSVESADEYGLLAVGGDLEVDTLLLAYQSGIFPWPILGEELVTWFAPPKRAVLFLKDFHLPKRLAKDLKHTPWKFKIDAAFPEVIRECGSEINRRNHAGTWLTDEMVNAYTKLHRAGYCHSVECYDDGELIGALYGVAIGEMFAGESMFYRKSNASKFCLCYLISLLREKGVKWIDCQQMTPHLKRFGAREITREEYMTLLGPAVTSPMRIFG